MKTCIRMLLVVCILYANVAFAGQQRPKEEVYAATLDMIDKAQKETEYEIIQDYYSRAYLIISAYYYRTDTILDDPEVARINESMRALEKELWEIYKAREEAGDKPKIPPAKYKTWEEELAIKAEREKAAAIAREKKEKRDAISRAETKAKNEALAKIPEVYITLRDERNQEVGRILDNGTVRNARNENIGAIEADGTVKDKSNQKIGMLKEDGTVTDGYNYKIGAIEPDGTVKNERNEKIGTAPKMKKEWAAAFFFFFFRQ